MHNHVQDLSLVQLIYMTPSVKIPYAHIHCIIIIMQVQSHPQTGGEVSFPDCSPLDSENKTFFTTEICPQVQPMLRCDGSLGSAARHGQGIPPQQVP